MHFHFLTTYSFYGSLVYWLVQEAYGITFGHINRLPKYIVCHDIYLFLKAGMYYLARDRIKYGLSDCLLMVLAMTGIASSLASLPSLVTSNAAEMRFVCLSFMGNRFQSQSQTHSKY
jgi:hypothetical protein